MYNFYLKYKNLTKLAIIILSALFIYGLLNISPNIFVEQNIYFYTFSTIVQGFMSLVALLGAIIIFKMQTEDQSLQNLSDGIKNSVCKYKGQEANGYTVIQMYSEAAEIIRAHKDIMEPHLSILRDGVNRMKLVLDSKSDARNNLVNFVIISFINIVVALISLTLTPIFVKFWIVGGIALYSSLILSAISLYLAFLIIKKAVGYTYKINV